MSPRLARLVTELEAARRRVHAIAERLDDTGWAARPSAAEWSVAECLSHLNLTSRAFVPLLRDALTNGRKGTVVSPFDRRLRYNAYSALRLIPAHQRQHLAQAERAVAAQVAPRSRVV